MLLFIVLRKKLQLTIKSRLKKLMVLLETPLKKFAKSIGNRIYIFEVTHLCYVTNFLKTKVCHFNSTNFA